MTEKDVRLFKKIRKHLFDLHTEWENDPETDGHCKSSEGYVGLILSYPNWFETDDYLNAKPTVGCEVYSYLFGPHRLHQYDTLQEAWDNVKTWKYR